MEERQPFDQPSTEIVANANPTLNTHALTLDSPNQAGQTSNDFQNAMNIEASHAVESVLESDVNIAYLASPWILLMVV